MKKTLLSVALTSVLASTAMVSTSASAVEGLTANVGVTSNYLWRGQEQTNGGAAISGGIDYSHASGFYAGTWTSNTSWGTTKTEVDLYAGFGGDLTDSISYDVGYIYFGYPDSTAGDNDFSEIYGSVTVSGVTLGLAVLATADGSDFGDSLYASVDYSYALSNGAEIALHAGNYSGDFATESTDVSVSISKDNFTFGVSSTSFEEEPGAGDDSAKFFVSYGVDFEL